MKKLITVAGSAVLLIASLAPVLATGNNCSNGTTGPLSTDYCTINNTSNITVRNVNDADITNIVTVRSNTGNNSASTNTLGGSVITGNATLNATVNNVANVNTTTITGGPAASGNMGTNNVTGPLSDNRINLNNTNNSTVENNNTATVNNVVTAEANTGDNLANTNTGPGFIRTGQSWLGVSLINHLNDSATGISAGAGGAGGNVGSNSTTGPESADYVTINNTANVGVTNVSDMDALNIVTATSKTGFNSASVNTLGGDILTGRANANIGVGTEGNINTTTLDLAMGGFTNVGSQAVTGPLSDNRETLLNNFSVTVDNINNKCKSQDANRLPECRKEDGALGVTNIDTDITSTGDNVANTNTGSGDVTTGVTDLVKNIWSHINDTFTMIK